MSKISDIAYWSYRLVRKNQGELFSWGIHECYFDNEDKIIAVTENPEAINVIAEPDDKSARKQIVEDLNAMLKAAKKSPILDYEKITGETNGN